MACARCKRNMFTLTAMHDTNKSIHYTLSRTRVYKKRDVRTCPTYNNMQHIYIYIYIYIVELVCIN